MIDLAGIVWSIVVTVLAYEARQALMPDRAWLAPCRRTVPVVIEDGRDLPRRRRVER